MDIKNMVRDFASLGEAKKRSSVYVKAVSLLCAAIVALVLFFMNMTVRGVTDRILVGNTGGEFLQLKSMETDKLYETLLKAHCNAVAYYVNSFDRMSISGNQAQAVFLVEKSELNAIWNKYLNDRAYADAADRGVIYKCVFEKLHRVGIRDDGYNVLFTSILSIHDAGGVKRIRIYSRGDAIRTTPVLSGECDRLLLPELYTGIRAVGHLGWKQRKKLNKTEEHEEDSSNHCQRVRVTCPSCHLDNLRDERKGRESEHRPS